MLFEQLWPNKAFISVYTLQGWECKEIHSFVESNFVGMAGFMELMVHFYVYEWMNILVVWF